MGRAVQLAAAAALVDAREGLRRGASSRRGARRRARAMPRAGRALRRGCAMTPVQWLCDACSWARVEREGDVCEACARDASGRAAPPGMLLAWELGAARGVLRVRAQSEYASAPPEDRPRWERIALRLAVRGFVLRFEDAADDPDARAWRRGEDQCDWSDYYADCRARLASAFGVDVTDVAAITDRSCGQWCAREKSTGGADGR